MSRRQKIELFELLCVFVAFLGITFIMLVFDQHHPEKKFNLFGTVQEKVTQ